MHFLRDACYHLGSNLVTASDAEVECGLLGGRLASFVLVSEVTSLKTVIPANDLWIGKHYKNFILFSLGPRTEIRVDAKRTWSYLSVLRLLVA